jgi:purine-binding chemotaxis protein CheW
MSPASQRLQPGSHRDRLHAFAGDLGTSDCSDGIREAAVVELDGHHYALIVDLVEDVVEALSDPAPMRAAMGPGWERVSQGMVETETGPLLLIDVAALLAGATEAKAA